MLCKLITFSQRAIVFILSLCDGIHVFENDTNNEDVTRFPITTLGLSFHNTIDTLRLSQALQKVRCAAQSLYNKTGENYHPPEAHIHSILVSRIMSGEQLFGKSAAK